MAAPRWQGRALLALERLRAHWRRRFASAPLRYRVDYMTDRPVRRAWPLALLALGVGLAAHAGYTWWNAHQRIATLDGMLRSFGEAAQPPPATGAGPAGIRTEEVEALIAVRDRLTLPWSDLFEPLERVRPVGVRLTAIDPEPDGRTVVITGEARDLLGVLSYVSSLHGSSGLREVMLTRFELQTSDPQFTALFAVRASWRGAP